MYLEILRAKPNNNMWLIPHLSAGILLQYPYMYNTSYLKSLANGSIILTTKQ